MFHTPGNGWASSRLEVFLKTSIPSSYFWSWVHDQATGFTKWAHTDQKSVLALGRNESCQMPWKPLVPLWPKCVCVFVCVCARVLSHIWLFVTLWTTAHQASLSMGFFSWNRLPFPLPGDLPNIRIEPATPVSPALHANSWPTELLGRPYSLISAVSPPVPSVQWTGRTNGQPSSRAGPHMLDLPTSSKWLVFMRNRAVLGCKFFDQRGGISLSECKFKL